MYKRSLFAALCLIVTNAVAQGPGGVGVSFLLIQPSVRANGMGGASVATQAPDAFSVAFNPAHLGNKGLYPFVSFEFYPRSTIWLPSLSDDIGYSARSIQIGYDLKQTGLRVPINVGAAYSRVSIDWGEMHVPGEDAFEPLGIVTSSESADVWSVGIGIDYFIKASAGLSLKDIDSNLGYIDSEASVAAHDLGVLIQLPISELATRFYRRPEGQRRGWQPYLSAGLGYSKSNIGGKIQYPEAALVEHLPRVARAGMNLYASLSYHADNWSLRLLSLERVHEAQHLLFRNENGRPLEYARFLGEINFWENVVLAHGDSRIETKRGWEAELFEFIVLRKGRYEDPMEAASYDTDGFGLKLSGVLKLMGAVNQELRHSSIYHFITRHVEAEYSHSNWEADEDYSFLDKTSFKSIRFGLVQR